MLFMSKSYFILLVSCGLFAVVQAPVLASNDDNPVCTEVGELMYGDQHKCKKGDVIMVNPMMSAFLCDMSLPNIAGEKTVVCHYRGSKRPAREKNKSGKSK